MTKSAQARHTAVLKYLQQHGRATVDELAEKFETTPQTIRKDLTSLAEANQIVRFHGGAALVGGTEYTGLRVRQEIAREEKDIIGRAVAAQIPNNASLIINAGTTTASAARHLEHHVGLKVVTDSVLLANDIREFAGLEVMVPGGVVRKSDGVILGEATVDFIRQFRVDFAIIGAAAIAPDGALLDYDLREASVARAIIENARTVILAVDSTKYGRAAPVRIGELAQVDMVVTDKGCPQALRDLCAAVQVRLFIAG
ncbi:MAG: DeoR/GlpR transcriptional regulator [Rhodobacteraceae bacterium]|nr:DeoR/GlpR transcriptional regulator [Paracoccaceae bacterium]